MIDLKALKEQLRLLGHDLPDEQVIAILKDMNIDFADTPPGNNAALPLQGESNLQGALDELPNAAHGLPRTTGSILDNFQGRGQGHQASNSLITTGEAAAVPASVNFSYGYTSPTKGVAPTLDHRKLASGLPPRPGVVRRPDGRASSGRAEDQLESAEYSDDCYDHDSDEEDDPTTSCRYCGEANGQPKSGGTTVSGPSSDHHGTWANRVRVSGHAVAVSEPEEDLQDLPTLNHNHNDLSAHFERATLNVSGVHASAVCTRAKVGTRPSIGAQTKRSASAAASKDQQHKAHGLGLGQPKERSVHSPFLSGQGGEDRDVGTSRNDRSAQQLGRSMQDWPWPPPNMPGGADGAESAVANDPYAAWLRGRGGAGLVPHLADTLLAQGQLSPQASNRSFASRAVTTYSTSSKRGTGAKKVDRVQRYQQLQQEWSQNRFLKQAGGAGLGTSRKPVNFHSHFASLHAAEEAERQRRLRETRARTKKELGAATEAPTANRRDELRWQTRMRLREQN